jgi:superfamily II DNA or RNA helicase
MYIGPKGFTIPKSSITAAQQADIKKELTIVPRNAGFGGQTIVSFPVYRESANKLYVPHYYGTQRFGESHPTTLTSCGSTNTHAHTQSHFNIVGKLRDYQINVIQKYVDLCVSHPPCSALLELYCGWGKTRGAIEIISKLANLYSNSSNSFSTLIIVHKEFLMTQWTERLGEFMPGARIGTIQGQTIDIENKDIVICMLQSLVQKEYHESLFARFAFTIIDEVHHISSQTFSTALFKVKTRFMLGLSATMERKDGTSRVIRMFLGDVLFKAVRDSGDKVEVRAITYKSSDTAFNEEITDYRGNPQNSSMISKLCETRERTEFILKVLCDFIRVPGISQAQYEAQKHQMDALHMGGCVLCTTSTSLCSRRYTVKTICCQSTRYCMACLNDVIETANQTTYIFTDNGRKKVTKTRPKCPDCKKPGLKYEQHYIENTHIQPISQRHTIVMSHNLNVLRYLYNRIVCDNLASVGYYVGGMSETELKKSEQKQIILASYSMAQEGLDISTLNAQFLITPKTDIVQILGRILRAKSANHPVVYDFVDTHSLFQRQWFKRKRYFASQKYTIVGTDSVQYSPDMSTWTAISTGGKKKKGSKEEEEEEEEEDEEEEEEEDEYDEDDEDELNKRKGEKGKGGVCLIPIAKKK